ncbi:LuxR C-terminal-related transcriptional regulator [Nonomuraea typhae]|uniref:LuxR C-terminal-related transcriptional regulator n=1 Tax=Nonomuraea typhae TaxID=2603600 RepID=A0ABW7Z8Y4_9ACTN
MAENSLAGLVSPQAQALYDRLTDTGALELDVDVDEDAPETQELLAMGVAFRGGEGDGLLRPIGTAAALRLLIDREHAELVARQARLATGWRTLVGRLGAHEDHQETTQISGIQVIPTMAEAAAKAVELYAAGTRLVRAAFTVAFETEPTPHRLLLPPPAALEAGARYLGLYDAAYSSVPWGRRLMSDSAVAGETVRMRREIPTKMILVDDAQALVAAAATGLPALLVTSPDLLRMLADWFDLMWRDSVDTEGEDIPLTRAQRRVVLQLAAGKTDEQIAHEAGISVRTVRRHIAVAMHALGAETRFAAGVAATRKGWL